LVLMFLDLITDKPVNPDAVRFQADTNTISLRISR
jgi:hypothetical protein